MTGLLLALLLLIGCARAPAVGTPAAMPTLDRSLAPLPGPLADYHAPPVVQRVLSNGLRVWIVERTTSPLVEVRLVIDAGATRETPDRSGLASLTVALLTEGTTQREGVEVTDQLGVLGGELHAIGTPDGALLTLSALAQNLGDILQVFAEVVQNPRFPSPAFERVRRQRVASLRANRFQAPVVADEEFAARIYGREHPYGRPFSTTIASLSHLTNDDVVSFYRAFYHPENAVLIVVGAVQTTTLLPMLERTLGSWLPGSVGHAVTPPLAPHRSDSVIYLVDRPGSAQSELRVGYPAIPRGDASFAALTLANTALGDYGRIWRALREEKGYAYAPGSSLEARRFAGAWRAYAAVQTDATAPALLELMRQMREPSSSAPVTEAELEAARNRVLRGEPFAVETSSQLAGRLQTLVLQGLGAGEYDAHLRRLRDVTTADVSSAIARVAGLPTVVVVGDRGRVEAPLRALGRGVQIVAVDSQ